MLICENVVAVRCGQTRVEYRGFYGSLANQWQERYGVEVSDVRTSGFMVVGCRRKSYGRRRRSPGKMEDGVYEIRCSGQLCGGICFGASES